MISDSRVRVVQLRREDILAASARRRLVADARTALLARSAVEPLLGHTHAAIRFVRRALATRRFAAA